MAASTDYHFSAILNAEGNIGKKMRSYASQVQMYSGRIVRENTRVLQSFTRMAAGIGIAAKGFLAGQALKGGFGFNAQMEGMNDQVATSMRLFNRLSPGVDATASAADRYTANLREADAVAKDLVRVANESPGGFVEVSQLFKSMLPAALQATGDMEQILKLTQQSTLAAAATGETFDEAGRDLARLLQGTAGLDVKLWRTLGPVISGMVDESGELQKSFGDARYGSEGFLKVWREGLTSQERFNVLMQATGEMGDEVADHFAKSWEGASSTAASAMTMFYGKMTSATFGKAKEILVNATSGNNFLATDSDRYNRIMDAMSYVGDKLAGVFEKAARFLLKAGNYFADNWERIFTMMRNGFARGMAVAKMLAGVKFARTIASAGAGVGSTIFKGAQTALPHVGKIMKLITGLGPWALLLAPAIATIGAAILGLAAVAAGFVAYWMTHWDEFIGGLKEGTVTLDPIFDAVDLLWVKIVALGEALFGSSDATSNAQGMIDFMSGAINGLISMISIGIRVLGIFQAVWNFFTAGLKAIYLGLMGMVTGVVHAIEAAAGAFGLSSMEENAHRARMDLVSQGSEVIASIKQDSRDVTQLLEAADAFDAAAVGLQEGITKGAQRAIEKGLLGKGGKGGKGGEEDDLNNPKGPRVHIHNMKVVNDLRNEDPDRIAGAFVKKLIDVTEHQTQALTLHSYGI